MPNITRAASAAPVMEMLTCGEGGCQNAAPPRWVAKQPLFGDLYPIYGSKRED